MGGLGILLCFGLKTVEGAQSVSKGGHEKDRIHPESVRVAHDWRAAVCCSFMTILLWFCGPEPTVTAGARRSQCVGITMLSTCGGQRRRLGH